jgi:hypothetical protein
VRTPGSGIVWTRIPHVLKCPQPLRRECKTNIPASLVPAPAELLGESSQVAEDHGKRTYAPASAV